jgi:hypothetical protein
MKPMKNKICSGLKSLFSGYPITPALMPGLRKILRVRALARNYDHTPSHCARFRSFFCYTESLFSDYPITPALMPGLRKILRVRALARNYDLIDTYSPPSFAPLRIPPLCWRKEGKLAQL